MNQAVLIPCMTFLVTWTCTEGIPQSNSFFVEKSDTFTYRANERCLNVPKSSPRKIANQMMDLMKTLEGEESLLINNVTSNLIRSGFTSRNMHIEPELAQSKALTLQKEFDTFSKIAALVWLAVTDPVGVKQSGWCSIKKLNTFLSISRPVEIVNQLQSLDQSISLDIRLILENFIRSIVWPTNKLKRPSLELTKFYKTTKRQKDTTSTTEVTTIADVDKAPIARSIMHLEADSEDSDEESTEVIKIPIITPTPTGRHSQETQTFRTHAPLTTPSLRTMHVHTKTPYDKTPPIQISKEITIKPLILEEEEDSDSVGELDIMTKSPYKTKLTTVDDGFFLDDDFVTRKSTINIIEHIPVTEDPLPIETSPAEEESNVKTDTPEPTVIVQAETVSPPISIVSQTSLLPEEDSQGESADSSSGSKSDSNESISVNDQKAVAARVVSSTAEVVVVTPAQRRANTEPEQDMSKDIDAMNAKPTIIIAVTVSSRAFTEDDTLGFMKLVSVDEEQLKAVNDHLDKDMGIEISPYNSNVKEYPKVLLVLLSNAIIWF